jgi:hypothetical protein
MKVKSRMTLSLTMRRAVLAAACAAMLGPFVLAVCWRAPAGTPAAEYVEHHPHEAAASSAGDVFGAPRSACWRATREAYIAEHPVCEACGTRSDLNVHHVAPFHDCPERECDPTNLITLCREHHLTLGHRCDTGKNNWSCGNPLVRKEAAAMQRDLKKRGEWPTK